MRDGFQTLALRRVAENTRPHSRTIQSPAGIQDLAAEFGHQVRERRCAWLHHVACNLIGIEDRYAMPGEHVRDGALAAGNTAGECDEQRTSFVVHVAAV